MCNDLQNQARWINNWPFSSRILFITVGFSSYDCRVGSGLRAHRGCKGGLMSTLLNHKMINGIPYRLVDLMDMRERRPRDCKSAMRVPFDKGPVSEVLCGIHFREFVLSSDPNSTLKKKKIWFSVVLLVLNWIEFLEIVALYFSLYEVNYLIKNTVKTVVLSITITIKNNIL